MLTTPGETEPLAYCNALPTSCFERVRTCCSRVSCGTVNPVTCTPPPPSPAPRRKVSAPVDNDLRARLSAALADGPAEPIAAAALVSVATVRKAARGEPIRAVVRAAIARVMPPATAATVAA